MVRLVKLWLVRFNRLNYGWIEWLIDKCESKKKNVKKLIELVMSWRTHVSTKQFEIRTKPIFNRLNRGWIEWLVDQHKSKKNIKKLVESHTFKFDSIFSFKKKKLIQFLKHQLKFMYRGILFSTTLYYYNMVIFFEMLMVKIR
jgi:hypothetical protein